MQVSNHLVKESAPTVQPDDDSLYLCIRGKKRYEFSNHLGNVMTTLTDRRVWSTNPDRWVADAVSGQDYDPFGMVRPNRSASDDGYRFGFNGKEKDTEFSNESYDFGARIYDGRVARWLSVDPLMQKIPGISPYVSTNNSPLALKDPDGKLPVLAIPIIVGALVGGVLDAGAQFTVGLSQGKSALVAAQDINLVSVGLSMINGGTLVATGGTSTAPATVLFVALETEIARSSISAAPFSEQKELAQTTVKMPDPVEVIINTGLNMLGNFEVPKAGDKLKGMMTKAADEGVDALKQVKTVSSAQKELIKNDIKTLQRNFNTGVDAGANYGAGYTANVATGYTANVATGTKTTNVVERFAKPDTKLREPNPEKRDATAVTLGRR